MAPVPDTRPSLVLRLRDTRDQQAWTTFLEIYQPLIYRLIRTRHVQDADAREITQEVLLAVAGSIDRWEVDPGRGTFRGWLSTITRNLVVNFLIRQSRHPRGRGDADFQQVMVDLPAPEGDESALFDLEQRRQVFRWAADRIRNEFRESHWLAFWRTAVEGHPVADVARELQISTGLIYVSRNRVMKRLREKVEEFEKKDVR
ncbi:RNA polymerase sigma factor [Schlesneria sp. T3-172]|uniref:RNA polymerase sigma factor n=1 Tax=Schlesneria sphaerica TaxID=3373610 RepID=UPI0037C9CBD8